MKVLKAAAKIRKVPAAEVLASLAVIKKEKAEPSGHCFTWRTDFKETKPDSCCGFLYTCILIVVLS